MTNESAEFSNLMAAPQSRGEVFFVLDSLANDQHNRPRARDLIDSHDKLSIYLINLKRFSGFFFCDAGCQHQVAGYVEDRAAHVADSIDP